MRPEDEHGHHHRVDHERTHLRYVVLAHHVAHAEHDRRDQRSDDAAAAAGGDDDEEVDEVLDREARIEPEHLDAECAAQSGQGRAERERDAEHAIDIDAQAARGARVVDRGAQLRAEARMRDHPLQRKRDAQADRDQEQAVDADIESRQRDLPAQEVGQGQRLLLGAEEVMRRGDGHEHQTDREQHLVEMRRAVQTAVQRALEHDADGGAGQGDDGQGREKRDPRTRQQDDADIAAEHREGAVREVDEVHQPQRHRQAHADQKQQHARRDTVEKNRHDASSAGVRGVPLHQGCLPGSLKSGTLSNSTFCNLPFTFSTLRM